MGWVGFLKKLFLWHLPFITMSMKIKAESDRCMIQGLARSNFTTGTTLTPNLMHQWILKQWMNDQYKSSHRWFWFFFGWSPTQFLFQTGNRALFLLSSDMRNCFVLRIGAWVRLLLLLVQNFLEHDSQDLPCCLGVASVATAPLKSHTSPMRADKGGPETW